MLTKCCLWQLCGIFFQIQTLPKVCYCEPKLERTSIEIFIPDLYLNHLIVQCRISARRLFLWRLFFVLASREFLLMVCAVTAWLDSALKPHAFVSHIWHMVFQTQYLPDTFGACHSRKSSRGLELILSGHFHLL